MAHFLDEVLARLRDGEIDLVEDFFVAFLKTRMVVPTLEQSAEEVFRPYALDIDGITHLAIAVAPEYLAEIKREHEGVGEIEMTGREFLRLLPGEAAILLLHGAGSVAFRPDKAKAMRGVAIGSTVSPLFELIQFVVHDGVGFIDFADFFARVPVTLPHAGDDEDAHITVGSGEERLLVVLGQHKAFLPGLDEVVGGVVLANGWGIARFCAENGLGLRIDMGPDDPPFDLGAELVREFDAHIREHIFPDAG